MGYKATICYKKMTLKADGVSYKLKFRGKLGWHLKLTVCVISKGMTLKADGVGYKQSPTDLFADSWGHLNPRGKYT